jgi:hypothetical protein
MWSHWPLASTPRPIRIPAVLEYVISGGADGVDVSVGVGWGGDFGVASFLGYLQANVVESDNRII